MYLAQSFGMASVAAATSFTASVLIVKSKHLHGKFSLDSDLDGIQKFHTTAVPRIGGIAVVTGIFLTLLVCIIMDSRLAQKFYAWETFLLTVAGMPAFLAGTIEDLTKKVSVKARLIATFISAVLASYLLQSTLNRVDVWGIDYLLAFLPFAIMFTAFAVAGVTNAINIIDGFHGVAGGTIIIILGAFAFLGWQAGDRFIVELALLGMCAALGFFLVNYPTGRIFMGDGGAYFLGFWTSEVAILLLMRNPHINAWQILAICAYPVIEVLFSIYRRRIIRKSSPGDPDRLHLHTLIYRRIACQILKRNDDMPWIRNAAVATIVSKWISTMAVLAIFIGDTLSGAIALFLFQVWLYVVIYTRLVRRHWYLYPELGLMLAKKTHEKHTSELNAPPDIANMCVTEKNHAGQSNI